MKSWHPAIRDTLQVLETAKRQHAQVVRYVQAQCKHELVSEAYMLDKPVRVCEVCGLTEHGNGIGFQTLKTDRIRHIGSIELLKLSLGEILSEDVKVRILRSQHEVKLDTASTASSAS